MTDPADDAQVLTPDDDTDLDPVPRSVYVGTGGNLSVVTATGTEIVFSNVPDGTVIPLRIRRLLEDSTADDIVGLY